jgi:hypothetical protein
MTAKRKGVAVLWLLNFLGNAALMAAVYFWLVLPDAHGWQVAASAALAAVVIFFGLWLRTGSFAYFRMAEFRENAAVWRAFRHALRHIVALALWAIPLAVLEWYLISLRRYAPQFGVWFWQKLPALLRFGSPRQMFHVADMLLLFLIWVLLPLAWLPVASTVSAAGLKPRRMARSLRLLKRLPYWLWFCLLLLGGVREPYRLVRWVPDLSTLNKQAWSMGVRFAIAYIVLITAWVGLLQIVGSRVETEDPEAVTTTIPPPRTA